MPVAELYRNLDEIAFVNKLLGGRNTLLQGIGKLVEKNTGKEWVIADIGCGSADLSRQMADYFRRKKIPVKIIATDVQPDILDYAKKLSSAYPEIEFRLADVFDPSPADKRPDIAVMNLFLHHFADDDIRKILHLYYGQVSTGIVVNDLVRSRLAHTLFKLFTFVFRSSYVTRHDGLLSIRRSFRRPELENYTGSLSTGSVTIRWKWAFRWQMVIRKK